MNLKDRVALVTGAWRGIGAATAEVLAHRGAQVAMSARTTSDLDRVASRIRDEGGQAFVVPCDVLNLTQIEAAIDAVVRHRGRLDILVNNTGLGTPIMPVEAISPSDWDRTLALNLKAAFLCIRAAAPVMKRQGCGRIVNVSSIAGWHFSLMSGPKYSAAKAGIIGLTKHMAVELGPFGINVNSVAPSVVLTERVKAKWEARGEEERQRILGCKRTGCNDVFPGRQAGAIDSGGGQIGQPRGEACKGERVLAARKLNSYEPFIIVCHAKLDPASRKATGFRLSASLWPE
ncbi:MAG: SDR family oxidoreductase [Deltaproteobacteria bacterium]|nr:SDR family oxidoreductase [Deltaproteobacteria bacterium]